MKKTITCKVILSSLLCFFCINSAVFAAIKPVDMPDFPSGGVVFRFAVQETCADDVWDFLKTLNVKKIAAALNLPSVEMSKFSKL